MFLTQEETDRLTEWTEPLTRRIDALVAECSGLREQLHTTMLIVDQLRRHVDPGPKLDYWSLTVDEIRRTR